MTPILWTFRRCPYAMRARMALHLADITYDHREVALRNKPNAMLDVSPKGTVPVLVLPDGRVLEESLEIIRWALPDAAIDTAFTDIIDGPFKHHLDRYKYKSRYDTTAQRGDVDLNHRAQAIDCLGVFETAFTTSDHLDTSALHLTDIATFPFIRQFAATEPAWWATQTELPKVRAWLSAWLESPSFAAIMQKHPLWQSPETH